MEEEAVGPRQSRRSVRLTQSLAKQEELAAEELVDAEHDTRGNNDRDYKGDIPSASSRRQRTLSRKRKPSSTRAPQSLHSDGEVNLAKLSTDSLRCFASAFNLNVTESADRPELLELCCEHFRSGIEIDEVSDESPIILTFAATLLNRRAISLEHQYDPSFFSSNQPHHQHNAVHSQRASGNSSKQQQHEQNHYTDNEHQLASSSLKNTKNRIDVSAPQLCNSEHHHASNVLLTDGVRDNHREQRCDDTPGESLHQQPKEHNTNTTINKTDEDQ